MDIIAKLTSKDSKYACKIADRIVAESWKTNKWFEHFDSFISLLDYPKSLVRNRALFIIAANIQWDKKGHFAISLATFLSHITDEKPITARQCIKALAQIGQIKPTYIPKILFALRHADLTKYKESMRSLIEKDIFKTERILTNALYPDKELLDKCEKAPKASKKTEAC